MSDLEDILDEVEGQLKLTTTSTTTSICSTDKLKESDRLKEISPKDCDCNKIKPKFNYQEAEDLLKEFKFEDTNPFGKNKDTWRRASVPISTTSSGPKKTKHDSIDDENIKCYPIYLSGSFELMGKSRIGFEKPCKALKCLQCDFKVLNFDNYKWDKSTDYLFLRNNCPDFTRLAAKLCKERGSRAYCCQCEWVNIDKLTNVKALPNLRWICSGGKY